MLDPFKKVSAINRKNIWETIIGAGATIAGGLLGYGASGDAADAAEDAAKASAKVQWDMYTQTREDQAPWREGGADAVNALRQKMGLSYYRPAEAQGNALVQGTAGAPPTAPAPGPTTGETPLTPAQQYAQIQSQIADARRKRNDMSAKLRENQGDPYRREILRLEGQLENIRMGQMGLADGTTAVTPGAGEAPPGYEFVQGTGELQMGEFEESPGYQFTLQEGLNAQQNALSAMGQNRSGKHLKSAAQYAEGLASTEYDNFLRRWYDTLRPLQSMAGQGQTSVQSTGQAGANAAGNIGQSLLYGGQASGAGSINQANALTSAITGGANNLLYQNALRNLPQQTAPQSNYNYGYGSNYGGYGQGGV